MSSDKNSLSEDRVREIIVEELDESLDYYVDSNEVKQIVHDAIEHAKNDFEEKWRIEHETEYNIRIEAMQKINKNIGNIVIHELEKMVDEKLKTIENKFLVELARKAMKLEEGIRNEN